MSPENCRRVQAACVQAAALFGSELWWKGEGAHGTKNRKEDLWKLVNQEVRLTLGAFRITNQGALSSDSALGQRLQSALGCWNSREDTVLLGVASPLDASTTIEEEAAAALEAKRVDRPGLAIFTDGSCLENGATGYAVTWKKGLT